MYLVINKLSRLYKTRDKSRYPLTTDVKNTQNSTVHLKFLLTGSWRPQQCYLQVITFPLQTNLNATSNNEVVNHPTKCLTLTLNMISLHKANGTEGEEQSKRTRRGWLAWWNVATLPTNSLAQPQVNSIAQSTLFWRISFKKLFETNCREKNVLTSFKWNEWDTVIRTHLEIALHSEIFFFFDCWVAFFPYVVVNTVDPRVSIVFTCVLRKGKWKSLRDTQNQVFKCSTQLNFGHSQIGDFLRHNKHWFLRNFSFLLLSAIVSL